MKEDFLYINYLDNNEDTTYITPNYQYNYLSYFIF